MRDLRLRADFAKRGVFLGNNAILAQDGVTFANGVRAYNPANDHLAGFKDDWRLAADAFPHLVSADLRDARQAMDAQPGLVTTPNAGVPLLFTSIIDPEVTRVIFAPTKAVEILGGETQRGTWIDQVAYFPIVENTGSTASYGDYSNNGAVDVNGNWVPRQPYHWQTFKRYGERQQAMWGAAGLNYAAELDMSVAIKFAQTSNTIYFNGVSGIANYGLLNDPSLLATISPTTKALGGTAWTNASAAEMFADVLKLYNQLLAQMGSNIDRNTPMTLALSPERESLLSTLSAFNVSARETIVRNWPNLRIETAPQYNTGGGQLMQLIVNAYLGQKTAVPGYTDKMRNHALITEASAWAQKVSAGSWGTIIRRPIAIAGMLGI